MYPTIKPTVTDPHYMEPRGPRPNPYTYDTRTWHGAPKPAPTRPHVRNNEETLPLLPPVINNMVVNEPVPTHRTITTTRPQTRAQKMHEKEDKIQDKDIGPKPKKIDSDIESSKVILEEVHLVKIGNRNLTEQNIIINTGNSCSVLPYNSDIFKAQTRLKSFWKL